MKKSSHLKITGAMKTDVGKVREINQDSMLSMQLTLNECCKYTQPRLFIVADGMGGEQYGEIASSIAIRSVATYLIEKLLDKNCEFPIKGEFVSEAIKKANREIHEYSNGEESRKGMGTTLTAVLAIGRRLIIGHVGDTRAYLINNNELRQLTEDHSLVNKLLKMGQITPEQAANNPNKNVIYKTLGTNPEVVPDVYEEELNINDVILICCDGLWDYFPQEELYDIIRTSENIEKIPEYLISQANERGGKDNITVIIFKVTS